MVKNQNLLVIVTILLLAVIIVIAKNPKRLQTSGKRYSLASVGTCITVAYGPHINGGANLLDLYLPDDLVVNRLGSRGSSPLIVFIHGGAWQIGDKSMMPGPEEFTSHGYAVASINYRLTGEAPHPAQIEDCLTAIHWLRQHAKVFKIDPDRIGVWGISAGGHLAALLGTTCGTIPTKWMPTDSPDRIQAVCDWCGPVDLITLASQSGTNYHLGEAVKLFLQASPEEKPSLAKEASPIAYVHKGLPPFLIMHGDKDTIIPLAQSQELAKALKSAGVQVNLQIMPGADHMFASQASVENVRYFFDQNLKK